VNVVVDVLAGDDGGDAGGVLALDTLAGVTELATLGGEAALDVTGVVVLEGAVLDGDDVVVVLLPHLGDVLDGLDRGVVVVLVDLLVDGGLDIFVLGAVDGLVGDGRGDLLVDGGVMVAGLGHEVLNCCLGGVHCVGWLVGWMVVMLLLWLYWSVV